METTSDDKETRLQQGTQELLGRAQNDSTPNGEEGGVTTHLQSPAQEFLGGVGCTVSLVQLVHGKPLARLLMT